MTASSRVLEMIGGMEYPPRKENGHESDAAGE